MQAVGFIETRGLVAAVESADAMLKAAEVRLVERTFVKGGIVTITVSGDVAAVKASVDAGVAAARRMNGTVLSSHVIPRPHESLDGLIIAGTGEPERENISETESVQKEIEKDGMENLKEGSEAISEDERTSVTESLPKGQSMPEGGLRDQVEKMIQENRKDDLGFFLNTKRVANLRESIDREYRDLDLEGKTPYDMTKKEIIAKLRDFYK